MATRPYHHGDLRRTLLAAAAATIAERGVAGLSLRALAHSAGVSHAAPTHHFGDKRGLLTALAAEGHGMLADALGSAGGDLLAVGVAYVRFAVEHRAHFAVMFQPDLYDTNDPQVSAARERANRSLTSALAQHSASAPAAVAVPPAPAPPPAASSSPAPSSPTAPPSPLHADSAAADATASDPAAAELAAWCLAHGFAALWLSGALPAAVSAGDGGGAGDGDGAGDGGSGSGSGSADVEATARRVLAQLFTPR
ncbi:TetR/AcrR family transcriptional regulator [Streptomyces sp. 796.1]|uniref:TetR/AcrR family transcriptional regulator n=1 Tax=Streptomyces sp. 796.1 TaxID=3163029 RepID=UPI0039C8D4FA